MNNWINFPGFAITAGCLWLIGLALIYAGKKNRVIKNAGIILAASGIVIIVFYISVLWIRLERPPLRTLGETRLWYLFFLPVIGLAFYLRWGLKWFLAYSIFMAWIFLLINLRHPENFDKVMMPALQSPWFVPHVVVYIFGYALLGVSTLVAVKGLYLYYKGSQDEKVIKLADNLVYFGYSFLTLGLLFGAFWAKQAWGHYWTWDPKETWAFLTWLGYLVYIHLRFRHPHKEVWALWMLALAFVILLTAWFGINYLPSAENSVHVYG